MKFKPRKLRGFFCNFNKKLKMNKTIKTVLLILGVILLVYGIYTMTTPETQVSIGRLDLLKVQDNTNSYIIIGVGLVAIVLSLLKGKGY